MINIAEVGGWYVNYIFIYYLCLGLVFKFILVWLLVLYCCVMYYIFGCVGELCYVLSLKLLLYYYCYYLLLLVGCVICYIMCSILSYWCLIICASVINCVS